MNCPPVIALVGNPNCGKTTLFNALTGARQRVGNWPGVTVEKKSGECRIGDTRIEVIDLPGTYSLDVVDREISLDERIARDAIHAGDAGLIVNIVDAANLERNLYLTLQLAEMGQPLLLALNMTDVAASKGIHVDVQQLSTQLGCPVVALSAASGAGMDDLKAAILHSLFHPAPVTLRPDYGSALEEDIAALAAELQSVASPRWLALRLLEGDDLAQGIAGAELAEDARQRAAGHGDDLDILIADARYGLAHQLASQTQRIDGKISRDLSSRIDRVVLNRILGIPIFLLLMYLMFLFTINLGGAFIDFFEQTSGAFLVDGLAYLLAIWGAPEWLTILLAKGVGGGLQTVATFIPVIGFLFLFLSVLEDSGYMARAAFVMDRCMRWIGLPGKSFVPLIVGFGCNVPAIMATRTLEQERDRLLTIAMAPFMSCGARLPVYVLFATAFFAANAQNVVFALYLIGIGVAVLTGLVLKNSLLKGESAPFIMELPPYHLPTLKGVLLHTWERLKSFILNAGRIIVPMVLALNFLNALGTDGSFGNEDSEQSVLAEVGRSIAPAFSPLGMTEENWPAAVGIFTGVLAKEAVVGTLNATYAGMAKNEAAASRETKAEEDFQLGERLLAAFTTIPEKLREALGAWADPLGLAIDEKATAEAGEADAGQTVMLARFGSGAAAFAYLLFILLYFPCTAAVAAIYQEAGPRWAGFVVAWTTSLGFACATLFYQIATFAQHPLTSTAWITAIALVCAAALLWMRRQTRSGELPLPLSQGA